MQVKYYRCNRNIDFEVGDIVLIKINYSQNVFWTIGRITKNIGQSAYLVFVEEDRIVSIVKRHKNHIYELKAQERILLSEGSTGKLVRMSDPQISENESIVGGD